MEKQKGKNKNILKYRAYQFSLDAIDLLMLLPKNYIFEIIGKQFLRSATSIAANIIEAQAGRTKRDFVNFYHISLKSANETKYWLCVLREKSREKELKEKIEKLLREAVEISNMLGASILTMKNKRVL
ncbi:MAG: four helix bundle protein [Candidatus Moranbacteria bacterium]|nr:four helix bundle protein [Candidatus Moranbacteria bacterium]